MFDSSDRRYMRRALSLADQGRTHASPNPTVGCVVVGGGKILGEGWHRYSQLEHAEVRALNALRGDARGATVYVTLEPCSHQGRTPPCVEALLRASVGRVVVAMVDPNPKVSGRGIARLRAAGILVEEGLSRDQAMRLNESYACHITTGRPLVVGKVGMSLDGRIATTSGDSRWITSPEAREFGQMLRRDSEALLVGVGTILADDPKLTYRREPFKDRPLLRVILDSRLRTPLRASVLEDAASNPTLIFCAPDAPRRRRKNLERCGAEVMPIPRSASGVDLRRVLRELGKRKVLGLLVEGGSDTHWSFISQRLVDKFYFIVAPRVLGGRKAIPAIGGAGFASIAASQEFAFLRDFRVGEDLVLETYPAYSRSILSPWRSRETSPSHVPGSRPASKKK